MSNVTTATRVEDTTKKQANTAYLAKLDTAIEDARGHGVYQYLGKDKNGKAIFSDIPQKVNL